MTKRHLPCLKSSWPLRAINGSHISSQLFLIAVWASGVAFTFHLGEAGHRLAAETVFRALRREQ